MYLNNYGVDAVLQLSRNFLQKIIIREAYTRPGESGSQPCVSVSAPT